jgi:hypothetical protein
MAQLDTIQYIFAMITYSTLCLADIIDFYYKMMILWLPSYLFGDPIMRIHQLPDNSDDELDSFDIFVLRLCFVMSDQSHVAMHGLKLRPFIDASGRFCVWHIKKYFPDVVMVDLDYIKIKDAIIPDPKNIKCSIDVNKRFDTINNKSCRFGMAF